MKTTFIFIIALVFTLELCAQETLIPFRFGNKFGLVDSNLKTIIEPEFDFIKVEQHASSFERLEQWKPGRGMWREHYITYKKHYIGYKLHEKNSTSSFIIDGKILLHDVPYKKYWIRDGIIQAISYKVLDYSRGYSQSYRDKFEETQHFYNMKGENLFPGKDFVGIRHFDEIDKYKKLNEVPIMVFEEDYICTFFLYDKSKGKISRFFFREAKLEKIDFSGREFDKERMIEVLYKDKTGQGKLLTLDFNGKEIQFISNNPVQIPPPKKENEHDYYDDFDIDEEAYYPSKKSTIEQLAENTDSIQLSIREVSYDLDKYYFPQRNELIQIRSGKLNPQWRYLVLRDGKYGLMNHRDTTLLIKAQYDEILNDKEGAYILRNGKKYGYAVWPDKVETFIEPCFHFIPVDPWINYLHQGSLLFKVFDEEGNFFCYANEKGELYYTPVDK